MDLLRIAFLPILMTVLILYGKTAYCILDFYSLYFKQIENTEMDLRKRLCSHRYHMWNRLEKM